jgi:hypothetical protein
MAQRRGRVVAAAAAGMLVWSGCGPARGRTTPPIRVAAPRIATTHLPVAAAEADGLTRFDGWPKACALLTVADLKAVLPQATKVVQTPREQRVAITNLGAGEGEDDRDVPGIACETRFWVAGTERQRHADPDIVRVEDIAVGDAATVKDNYDAIAHAKRKVAIGGLDCVLDVHDYYCRTRRVAFSVGTGSSLYIDRFVGQPKKVESWRYWVNNVLPEFIRTVASKLPRT